MTKFNFTKEALLKLEPPQDKQKTYYSDTKERGLTLLVWSTGGKVFYLQKRVDKKFYCQKIGPFPEITIDEARETALKMKREILLPQIVQLSEITFKELFDRYINDYAKYNTRSWKEDTAEMNRNAKHLYDKGLFTIQKSDILEIFNKMTIRGKYGANRFFDRLSAIFNKGIEWELLDKNPATGITKHKEKSRDRYITSEEMERFIQAINEEPNKAMADFFMMCLYTGARRGNVQAMRWENISFTDRTWYLPDTKNGTPQTIPLIPYATEILERRNNENLSNSEWVFPAKSHTGHLQEPKKIWYKILERACIEDLRMHDLRRTLGSIMAQNGTSLHIVGKALNHKSPQSTNIYARLNVDPVRRAMEGAGETINIRYEV